MQKILLFPFLYPKIYTFQTRRPYQILNLVSVAQTAAILFLTIGCRFDDRYTGVVMPVSHLLTESKIVIQMGWEMG